MSSYYITIYTLFNQYLISSLLFPDNARTLLMIYYNKNYYDQILLNSFKYICFLKNYNEFFTQKIVSLMIFFIVKSYFSFLLYFEAITLKALTYFYALPFYLCHFYLMIEKFVSQLYISDLSIFSIESLRNKIFIIQ